MGKIGEPFEDAEEVLVPAAKQDLHIASEALRTEQPNRATLSPLSEAGDT
jgi:hypothetical protein